MATHPFPIQPELTAIAIAYRNPAMAMIADQVAPRVPVGVREFKYLKHALADGFTLPDTRVGRKSAPNEVEFSASELTDRVEDYGLDDPVPQDDIDTAPPNYDPLGDAVEGIMDLVDLDREVRVANMTFDAANYATANKTTLSGTSQWSDSANSNPLSAILDALDVMVMRATILATGRLVWTKLSQHPKMVEAVKATGAGSNAVGTVTRQQVADLLELQAVYVGEAWLNTAKKGQAVTLARAWGKHCALLHRNPVANTRRGATFALTAQFGTRIAGSQPDSKIGLRGGQRVRAGESVKELITANDLGYLFTNAIA